MFTIPIVNELSYRSIPRNKELNLTIENHCDFPSRVLVVDWQGNCFVCACEAWLPITVGNITDFSELTDVWNSSVATALQADIDQKKFTFCAVDRCGILNQNMTAAEYSGHNDNPNIYYISINIDESCNLHCPSCRKETVMYNSGPEYETRLAMVNHMVGLLERCDYPMHVIMSGNGDPLASNILRPLLHRWQPKKDQTIRLFTNGLLLEKQLTNNKIVDNITQYFISIDAGSAEIYEQVRAPGKFDILMKNFDFLRQLVDQTKATVLLKFVLQQTNYNDMQNFVDLCEKYQFNGVINRLEDWGTWDEYAQHDVVGNVDHPLHDMTIDNLKKIYAQNYPFLEFNSSLKELAK